LLHTGEHELIWVNRSSNRTVWFGQSGHSRSQAQFG
jgi:hypothetical protein